VSSVSCYGVVRTRMNHESKERPRTEVSVIGLSGEGNKHRQPMIASSLSKRVRLLYTRLVKPASTVHAHRQTHEHPHPIPSQKGLSQVTKSNSAAALGKSPTHAMIPLRVPLAMPNLDFTVSGPSITQSARPLTRLTRSR
jgi:hypothetical protein